MTPLTEKTMQEDIGLCDGSQSLWDFKSDEPAIKQIYGHFLPPQHMKIVDGLVVKDFNFPAAYHRAPHVCTLGELHMIGESLSPESIISLDRSVIMREERDGVVLYTPYFNGFFANKVAADILMACAAKTAVRSIASQLDLAYSTVLEFIARALTLGIIEVHGC
jgi:hypothetical protein